MKKLLVLFAILSILLISCGGAKEEEKKKAPVTFEGTFLEVLAKATELVQATQPKAIFAEADATVKAGAMTATDFTGWKFVYWVDLGNSVIIEYKDNTFSNITAMPYGIWEDWLIRERVTMELPEAIDLMRKANYDCVIKAGNLKRPLHPGSNEVFYIFGTEIGHIFVGTVSKTVTINRFQETENEEKK